MSSVVCRLSSSVVCDVLYCGKTVRPSEKVSEGVKRKPGSKSSFFGSPPYFFRFRRYGHRGGRFCLIFARTAKQLVLADSVRDLGIYVDFDVTMRSHVSRTVETAVNEYCEFVLDPLLHLQPVKLLE